MKQLLHNSDPKKLPDYFTVNDSKIENKHIFAEQLNNYFGIIGLQMASNMRSPANPNITFSR